MHTRAHFFGLILILSAFPGCGSAEEPFENTEETPAEPESMLLSQLQHTYGDVVLDLRDLDQIIAITPAVDTGRVTLIEPDGRERPLGEFLIEHSRRNGIPLVGGGLSMYLGTDNLLALTVPPGECFVADEIPCGPFLWARVFNDNCNFFREIEDRWLLEREFEEGGFGRPSPEDVDTGAPPTPWEDPWAEPLAPEGDPLGGGDRTQPPEERTQSGGASGDGEGGRTSEEGGHSAGGVGGAGGGFGGTPSGGRL
jgi:hypothetical protein